MTIIERVERLVNGLKDDEASRGYCIERPVFETFGDVTLWLREWQDKDGGTPWFTGEGMRETVACRFLFARYRLDRGLMSDHPLPEPISPTWPGLGADGGGY